MVKVPRFAFEKFPGADPTLTTTMKSVGEAMALGRSFPEALNKALRSTETADLSFGTRPDPAGLTAEEALHLASLPRDGRLYAVERALRLGNTVAAVSEVSGIDPWFVEQIEGLVELRREVGDAPVLDAALLRRAKRAGLSDLQIARVRPELAGEGGVRALRHRLGVRPVYKTVDTCAAEFPARTPYHYSAYESDPTTESEVAPQTERPKVIILGSGPNRIGQGIEFDYSCVHAATSLRAAGFETVMLNCNPETVSTDYDTADRLYFEPLTEEDVLEVVHAERLSGGGDSVRHPDGTRTPGLAGVVVQLGGQTPLKLAAGLEAAGVPIVGTPPAAIDLAEERGAFGQVLQDAGLPAPPYGTATSFSGAREIAAEIGYPVLVRPSYVLGGRGMEIVYDDDTLGDYIARATEVTPDHPVLVDRFLDDAIEIDVDALCDVTGEVYLGGIMEHIEEAGVHSGDSSCTLPPITLGLSEIETVRASTVALARRLGVLGLMNVQYALKDEVLYVLEANPRASRTVPFVAKATGVPLASAASRVMLGSTIAGLRHEGLLPAAGDGGHLPHEHPVAVKEAVLPFHRFRRPDGRGVDSLLGPEMKSTGEVMGIDVAFSTAFAKAQAAASGPLPTSGRVFVSVANRDKRALIFPVKRLADLGFEILATAGTASVLERNGISCQVVRKHFEGPDNVVDTIQAGGVDLIINTPVGHAGPRVDGYEIRAAALNVGVPCVTTVQGAAAAVQAIEAVIRGDIAVTPLQVLHERLAKARIETAGTGPAGADPA